MEIANDTQQDREYQDRNRDHAQGEFDHRKHSSNGMSVAWTDPSFLPTV
jgi:hypothetical protein